jgi:hypothetical protein
VTLRRLLGVSRWILPQLEPEWEATHPLPDSQARPSPSRTHTLGDRRQEKATWGIARGNRQAFVSPDSLLTSVGWTF